jgi:hypothetical protein
VPGSLDRQLRQRARNLGMSVSTIVRHVLLNTFGLVEDVVADSTNIALSIAGADTDDIGGGSPVEVGAAGDGDAGVIAWHEAVLNRNAVCDRCNTVLRKKSRAAIGLRERPGSQVIRCLTCLRSDSEDDGGKSGPQKRSPRQRPKRRP